MTRLTEGQKDSAPQGDGWQEAVERLKALTAVLQRVDRDGDGSVRRHLAGLDLSRAANDLRTVLAALADRESWKVVPTKATPEMERAGADALAGSSDRDSIGYAVAIADAQDVWEAMVAAASQPPAVTVEAPEQ